MPSADFTKQALERSAKAVALRPAIGQYTHKNIAEVRDGTVCRVREKAYDFTFDVPAGIGGGGTAPSPGALVRSALTSCIAIGFKLWAARADLPVDSVEVHLEADADARGELGVDTSISPSFSEIRLTIMVTSPAPKSAVEDVIAQSLKYSPILDVYATPKSIRIESNIKQSTEELVEGGVS